MNLVPLLIFYARQAPLMIAALFARRRINALTRALAGRTRRAVPVERPRPARFAPAAPRSGR
jgi:hypothetical protein